MKPKICELLDVEIDEEFYFRGKDELYRINKIERGGEYCLQRNCDDGDEDQWFPAETKPLIRMIDHPEEIVKKPRWNSNDIEDAKAVKRLWENWEDDCEEITVTRSKAHLSAELRDRQNGHVYDHCFISGSCFPSVRVGQTVKVDNICLSVS